MAAGIPGTGINGVYYTLLVVVAPLREIPRTLAGKSSVARWKSIGRLFALTASVVLVLAGEYWLFAQAADYARLHWGDPNARPEGLAKAFESLAPRLALAPFVILAAVLLFVQFLRLSLWLRKPLRVRGRTAAMLVLVVAGGATYAGAAVVRAHVGVHPPAGFDFSGATPAVAAEYDSLDDFYKRYSDALSKPATGDAYGAALADQTIGLMRGDRASIEKARDLYARHRDATSDPRQKEIAALGANYAAELLSGAHAPAAASGSAPEPVVYAKVDRPSGDFHRIVIGRSAIHVKKNALVKTQADRVTRDWLLAHNATGSPWSFTADGHVPWHEGEKMRELAEFAGARIVPVWGTKAVKIGSRWFAPDASGAPRFEISEDKIVNYPTTIVVDERHAVVNDTHGISAVAWDSLDADLVVGCGDHQGKMDAAYWLAERGVDVYVPTDRFIGVLVGAKTKGTIVGSAPVKREGDGAVIGAQPIAIDVDEPIVVSTSQADYPIRYYDAPERYFRALAAFCGKPLRITEVEVKEYGKAEVVVDEARRVGAKVIGIRVKSKSEHAAVAKWLAQDASRRAVLFHTAVYPDGYALFSEFPAQTSFGDVRPVFE